MRTLAKKPLQVYLRPEQLAALRALAERRGVSLAELVRQGVDRLLADLPVEEDPLWDIVGLFDSGVGDLAEKHDEYLAQLIDEENR
ncbi:MAG: ribbon-helix-helix domain-containing protein [Chloroflexi bacterium]|nr:ribbon-helix-helix domain-containing protein [Chloroflexota bacterium]